MKIGGVFDKIIVDMMMNGYDVVKKFGGGGLFVKMGGMYSIFDFLNFFGIVMYCVI